MTTTEKTPEGQVADAVHGNWVDRFAPVCTRPYLRLSRADRPIGTWLLLLPCWWGLLLGCLTNGRLGLTEVWIAAGCAIGAFLMRGAGCTWNDFTDRKIDAQVARTKSRPLPSGQVTPRQALIWMGLQAALACGVLITFNGVAIGLGILALVPVLIYPFAKRFTWWPQVFLGIAFNWGILLAYAAQTGGVAWPAFAAYLGGIAWTLFYDTIYAHQDTEDDALIGVKSTALLFGDKTPRWLRRFMVASVLFLGLAFIGAALDRSVLSLVVALCGVWAMGWHLVWQLGRFNPSEPEKLMVLFRSNRTTGLIPVLFSAVALGL